MEQVEIQEDERDEKAGDGDELGPSGGARRVRVGADKAALREVGAIPPCCGPGGSR